MARTQPSETTISDAALGDRRTSERQQLVLRVGILEGDYGTSFCLVRNISPKGVQVRTFATVPLGSTLDLRVGDEDPVRGWVVWLRDQLAGIEFESELSPERLLRVRQVGNCTRRRGSPRLKRAAAVVLRSEGRRFNGRLCDISTSGVRIQLTDGLQPQRPVTVEMKGLPSMKAFVRWSDEGEAGLSFATLLPIQILAAWLDDAPATLAN